MVHFYLSSDKLGEMTKAAYASGWEELPPSFRRYALNLLMITQRPRSLSGFGLVNCDLDTFCEVTYSFVWIKLFELTNGFHFSDHKNHCFNRSFLQGNINFEF